MTRAFDMHFAENIGRMGKFVFGFELDAELALRVKARSDDDELRTGVIEQADVLRREATAAKFALQRLSMPLLRGGWRPVCRGGLAGCS
ncbi:MAG: hypothetical protein WA633_09150, partial [Stellaceae bacterium]